MSRPLSIDEALGAVLAHISPLAPCTVPLAEALGRALAEDLVAREGVPPFTNAAMDGFALRAADAAAARESMPVSLRIVGSLPAGQVPNRPLGPDEAIRIMTGAPLPQGADAVVPVELASVQADRLLLTGPVAPGTDVRLAGEDVPLGARVLASGTRLRPGEVGVLATLGFATVPVRPRARVAVITTGDELVDCSERPGPGRIRDANLHALCAQVRAFGGHPLPFPRIPDDRAAVMDAFQKACASADLILSTGGVSVGDFDFVKSVLEDLGAERIFWRVAQKPGGPFGFYLLQGKPFFGIPGNPVAAMVMVEEYVRPALLKQMGHRCLFRPDVSGVMECAWEKRLPDGKTHFLRVRARREAGTFRVSPTGAQGSGILTSMMHANALALVGPEVLRLELGDPVRLHLLDEPEDH